MQFDAPPEMTIDPERDYRATIGTTQGDIEVQLFPKRAPRTVNNFVFLAREGFYDGVLFHRVIEGFMVQGGDPTGTGTGGPGYRFDDELEAARDRGYPRGTLAMANAGPDTNGSQFFIVHRDSGLPPQYSVFGMVIDGFDAVDAIATTDTDGRDRPREDQTITGVTVHEE